MPVNRDASTLRGNRIDGDGRTLVRAVVDPELAHASDDGDAYAYTSVTQAMIAAETGLLVKNTDTKPLRFEAAWLSVDTDTRVQIHFPTVEVVSPDGVNAGEVGLNRGEPSDGDRAVAKTDETTNAQGDIFWSGEIMAADGPYEVDLRGAPRLIKNQSIAIDVVTLVGAFDFVLHGHFEE